MHDCAGRHRGLLAAGGAFERERLPAVWPPLPPPHAGHRNPRDKPRGAGVIVGKLVLEFDSEAGKWGADLETNRMFIL